MYDTLLGGVHGEVALNVGANSAGVNRANPVAPRYPPDGVDLLEVLHGVPRHLRANLVSDPRMGAEVEPVVLVGEGFHEPWERVGGGALRFDEFSL